MNDVFMIILIYLAIALSLDGFLLAVAALFPRRVGQAQAVFEAAPGRSILAGAINLFFFLTVAVFISALADLGGGDLLRLLAALTLVPPAAAAALGLAGQARMVGARLWPAASETRRTVFGAAVLILGCSLPIAGWFLLLPYVLAGAAGAAILGIFRRQP